MKRKLFLFSYRDPAHASRTLRALRSAHPATEFEVVSSPLAVYAFRYLIKARKPDGSAGYVSRVPLRMIGNAA